LTLQLRRTIILSSGSGNRADERRETMATFTDTERQVAIRTIDVEQGTGAETPGYSCTVGEMDDDNADDDEVAFALRLALDGYRGHIGGGAQPHVIVEMVR